MLKRLIQWFKSLFANTATVQSSSQTTQAQAPVSIVNPYPQVDAAIAHIRKVGDPLNDFTLVQKMGRGPSEAEKAYAISQGVVWREAAHPIAGPDRNGFDLNASNVYLVHPEVTSGEWYSFTYPAGRGTHIAVFPHGTHITAINGEAVSDKDFEVGNGVLRLKVDAATPRLRVAVQLAGA